MMLISHMQHFSRCLNRMNLDKLPSSSKPSTVPMVSHKCTRSPMDVRRSITPRSCGKTTGNLGKFSKGTEYSFLELSINIQKSTAGIETLFHYWRHTQNVRLTDVSWVLNLKLKFSILAFQWYNTAKFFQMAAICQSNDCCNWNLGKKSLEPPNNEIDGRFVWFIHHKTALCYLRCGYCSLWLNR